ncbi:MAG TPA: nitroreductase [Pseudonocardia sp.]
MTMAEIPGTFGLAPEQVEGLLQAAGRAPSLHNSQPWRFRLTPHLIELYVDPRRRLPEADPDDCELRMACGAALFNLRLALHGHGIRPVVTILPDRSRPDLLAVVRHGGRKTATPEQMRLLRVIPLRRTNRHPFSEEPVLPPARYALRRAAVEEGAWLHLVDEPRQRKELQRMALKAHRAQMADPGFRAELERWTALPSGRRDGVPATAGGPLSEPQDRWVLRDFRDGSGPARFTGKDFETEPLLAVLTAHLSGPLADVQAGLALERILLTATADGLAVSFLSHIVEVGQTREELRRLLGETRPPQAVLRIGHGYPVTVTPRRAVTDLLAPEASPP